MRVRKVLRVVQQAQLRATAHSGMGSASYPGWEWLGRTYRAGRVKQEGGALSRVTNASFNNKREPHGV